MKKVLLILSFMVFSIPMIAQNQTQIAIDVKDELLDGVKATTEYVTDSNVEKLVDKYSIKLEASIVALAETLEQPAEYVYQILIKQQYIKAYIGIIIWLFFIVLLVLFVKVMKKGMTCKTDTNYNFFYYNETFIVVVVIIGIAMAGFFIASLSYIQNIIQGFINPEYGAIQDIVDLIK